MKKSLILLMVVLTTFSVGKVNAQFVPVPPNVKVLVMGSMALNIKLGVCGVPGSVGIGSIGTPGYGICSVVLEQTASPGQLIQYPVANHWNSMNGLSLEITCNHGHSVFLNDLHTSTWMYNQPIVIHRLSSTLIAVIKISRQILNNGEYSFIIYETLVVN